MVQWRACGIADQIALRCQLTCAHFDVSEQMYVCGAHCCQATFALLQPLHIIMGACNLSNCNVMAK